MSQATPPSPGAAPIEPKLQIAVEPDGMPRASSTFANHIDDVYWTWLWISIPFFVVVVVPMIYFAFKYKRKREDEPTSPIDHHLRLEIFWTIVPTIVLIYMFWVGLRAYADASVPPNDSYEIKVTGQMFNWTFEYPDGTVTTELGVPKDKPVKLVMSSKDTIHAFWVPEFRVKTDVVPGLYTTMWFEANREMTSAVECAEYCGDGHSKMLTQVHVLPSGPEDKQGTFEYWLLNGGEMVPLPPVQLGQKKVAALCSSCHSLDGSRIQGPSFKGVFGRKERLADGSEVTVDENYIRRSIIEPQSQLVEGYPPTMPTFGYLKEKDIDGIIAYLKEQK
jgi:cytochrome c oxidase subunit 2